LSQKAKVSQATVIKAEKLRVIGDLSKHKIANGLNLPAESFFLPVNAEYGFSIFLTLYI